MPFFHLRNKLKSIVFYVFLGLSYLLNPSLSCATPYFLITDFSTAPTFVLPVAAANVAAIGTNLKMTEATNGISQGSAAWYPSVIPLNANNAFSVAFTFEYTNAVGNSTWNTIDLLQKSETRTDSFDFKGEFTPEPTFAISLMNNGVTPIVNNHGADGFFFVVQKDARGTAAIGGPSTGFNSVNPSLGLEFDISASGIATTTVGGLTNTTSDCQQATYIPYDHIRLIAKVGSRVNSPLKSKRSIGVSDFCNKSIAFTRNGSTGVGLTNCISGFNFSGGGVPYAGVGPWYAWLDYNGTTAEARVSQTNVRPATANLSYAINLNSALGSSNVYMGFTGGGSGGARTTLYIRSFKMIGAYAPFSSVTSLFYPAFTTAYTITVYDPSNQNLKAIPGNQVTHSTTLSNTAGPADAGTLKITLDVLPELTFIPGSVTFTDAVGGGATGLTCCSGSNIEYSTISSPYSWTSTMPVPASNIRALRITPTGTMNDGYSGATGFNVSYRSQIN